jgi:hypothetical protein
MTRADRPHVLRDITPDALALHVLPDDFPDEVERNGVIAIWLTPSPRPVPGTDQVKPPVVLSLRMVAGPKRYLRIWLADGAVTGWDWGWHAAGSAVLLWSDPLYQEEVHHE